MSVMNKTEYRGSFCNYKLGKYEDNKLIDCTKSYN